MMLLYPFYRHSRARRSENLFGILANRWRVLRNILLLPPSTIEVLVMATLTLQNFLRKGASREIYCPPGLLDEEDPTTGTVRPGYWRQEHAGQSLLPLQVPRSGHNIAGWPRILGMHLKIIFSVRVLYSGSGIFVCRQI